MALLLWCFCSIFQLGGLSWDDALLEDLVVLSRIGMLVPLFKKSCVSVLHFPWRIAVYVIIKSSVINILEFRDLGGVWVPGRYCRHCCLGDQGSRCGSVVMYLSSVGLVQ